MVRRARTNMSGDIFVASCVLIHPAIHITIIEPDLSDADKAVEVLLNLSRGRRGAAALISQRILIGLRLVLLTLREAGACACGE